MSSTALGLDDFGLLDQWGPENVICVVDRRTDMRRVLVIVDTARAMGKGGTRMTPTVSVTRDRATCTGHDLEMGRGRSSSTEEPRPAYVLTPRGWLR